LFRVNAQQKCLDIWLIYKCQTCDTTWNLTVLSRINPQSLPSGMLDRYANNDSQLAMLHATDAALIKRNGADCGAVRTEAIGEEFDWSEPAEICLAAKWGMEIKAATLIREKLGLSRNAFEKMCEQRKIVSLSGQNLEKCKMNGKIVLQVNP
jgi:hypothetical protein